MARLQAGADATWKHLDGSIVEAGKRTTFAREIAAEGQEALAAGRSSEAGQAARAAQLALGQATALYDAIANQDKAVADARQQLPTEIAAAEADLNAAKAAVDQGRVGASADQVVRAQALLDSARREASAPKPDVLAGLKFAGEANAAADAILEGVRAAEEQRAREQAALASSISRAETSYRQAADFILSRHQGVGREARTRLNESERVLGQARALQATDLVRAAAQAGQAERLAQDAFRLAQGDFAQYDRRPSSGPISGGGGPDMGGILGGIIMGGILSGAARGGGFGGTSWGSPMKGGGGMPKLPSSGGRSRGGGGGGRVRGGGRW
jgi:hypothetical protein